MESQEAGGRDNRSDLTLDMNSKERREDADTLTRLPERSVQVQREGGGRGTLHEVSGERVLSTTEQCSPRLSGHQSQTQVLRHYRGSERAMIAQPRNLGGWNILPWS